jgi:Ribbon-helix-helix protein, copG family
MYTYSMPAKMRYNFMIDEALRDALRRIKEREGIPESEQIRRAIAEWLERRGETVRVGRTRTVRKQS